MYIYVYNHINEWMMMIFMNIEPHRMKRKMLACGSTLSSLIVSSLSDIYIFEGSMQYLSIT